VNHDAPEASGSASASAAKPPVKPSTDPLLAWRKEFPILEETTYLISHSLGAMPRRAQAALKQFAETWAARGVRAWEEGWWEMPITSGDLIGSIIGAGPGEVVMHQNVSVCQWVVSSCFDWKGPRNKIVSEGLNFPSNDYIYHALERYGARVCHVPSPDGMTLDLEPLLAAIDEQTQLVSVSHVSFRSSFVQDLAAIIRRAHEVGALVIADLYQSAGILPINVHALEVDFATGGSVKWLCGGPGAAYLYVRPGLRTKLQPAATGWMAHRRPFEFEDGPIDLAPDAFRFLSGTPNVPALYSARSGYEIVNEIGVDAIRAKSLRQTERLIALADDAGVAVRSCRDPRSRGGVVVLDVPNGQAVTHELVRRNVLVDYRPNAGIRISPHFYTADEEIDRAIEEVKSLVSDMRQ
jgi:kynureninase